MERSEDQMKQDRRLKPTQGDHNQQPQKCPRCESINTKFCYYNNYSLAQPRYFCKTCRRYWTHGGTLRNVPVGGGCRKGKRLKTSGAASPSSGENSRSQSQSQSQHQNLGTNYSAANTALVGFNSSNTKESVTSLVCPSIESFYPAGGFLNSLAVIQSLSNNPTHQSFPLNHQQQPPPPVNPPDLGGAATSNLNLLNGFNAITPFGSNPQGQLYQMGNLPQQQQNWQRHSYINSSSNIPIVADTSLWSISTSTTAAAANNNGSNTTTASAASFPLSPNDNQWHDLSGYTSPP